MSKNLSRRDAVAALAAWPFVGRAAELSMARPVADGPLVVAFVFVSPVGEAGWTYQHDLGRRELERTLGARVKTIAVESVAEGPDAERVMRDLVVAQGAKLVFATSFGYLEPALRVAADHPEARFEHAGGYKLSSNLATYDARYYEARYVAGWLAGKATRSGVAGYVAGFPIPEVIQGINAFALGMRAARSGSRVRVLWLDAWFDPPRERDAAQALIDADADVLTHHSGSTAVAIAAEANHRDRGTRVIAYPSDMRRFAPEAHLAAIVHRWGGFYVRTARAVLDGSWQARPVWGGIDSGMVDIAAVDERLSANLRQAVTTIRRSIESGTLRPFSGRLLDNAGTIRSPGGGSLEDAEIKTMSWLAEGVIGTLPVRR